jgi:hypothetical protein
MNIKKDYSFLFKSIYKEEPYEGSCYPCYLDEEAVFINGQWFLTNTNLSDN